MARLAHSCRQICRQLSILLLRDGLVLCGLFCGAQIFCFDPGFFILHVLIAFAGKVNYLKLRFTETDNLPSRFSILFFALSISAIMVWSLSSKYHHATSALSRRRVYASVQRRGSQNCRIRKPAHCSLHPGNLSR